MTTYTMASFMANIQVAKGDKNEGKTHEYYATAEYFGKLEASNNVNLKNPAHHPNPAPTSGNKSGATKPPAKQQPNQRPVPPPPAPKKDTYKTPITPKAKTKSPDPQGKIISAEFVDMVGKPYKSMKFGTHVRAKIISKNMTGKTVRLKIWEDDISNVLLFEKDYILGGDETFITLFLTAQMRKDGDDWKEGNEQEYFLEIEYAGQSVDSEVINVNDSAPKIKVAEPAVSMTGVGANRESKPQKGKCFCNRDFTPEEFEKIIHELRDSELAVKKGSGYVLFAAPNCKLKAEDKTINKLRDHINSIFNEYGINTCIRKLHFLAQIYHETDRLRTTLEYATNKNYKPYFGRGLMQLTWESNYYVYKDYRNIDCVTNFEIIEKNFYYACDSAGWFWKKGKVLTVGKRWKGPADAPEYVKIQKPDYPKTTITYKKGNTTIKYGTVDMGLIADDDKVDLISYLVNGGANGIQERRNYVITLKNIFQYPNICINKKKAVPKSDNDNEVTLHFTGKSAKEDALSEKTKKILREVGKASGNYDIYITSTARTPYDQARIMYDNCKSDLAEQRRTYAPPGQKVIDVYVNNKTKSRDTVIKLMEQKINELGPSTVSKHLANPEFLNTFDVSYGNLTDKTKFWNEMKKRSELDDILNENKCYHIQINQ